MANHKYRKTRTSRAGCHLCKPHKVAGNSQAATKAKYRRNLAANVLPD